MNGEHDDEYHVGDAACGDAVHDVVMMIYTVMMCMMRFDMIVMLVVDEVL